MQVQTPPLSTVLEQGINNNNNVGGGRERSISPSKLRSASPSRKAKVPIPHAAAPGGNHHHKPRSRGISPSKTIRSRRANPDRTRSSSYSSGEDSFSNLSSDDGGGSGPQHNSHHIAKPRHPQKRNSFTSLNGSEISARMKQRSSLKPTKSASSSSGGADHEGGTTHSKTRQRSSLHRSIGDLSKSDSGSGSRLGAASQFLRNTHRKLKDGIAEKQEKISQLRDEIAGTQVEIAFLNQLASMNEEKKVELLFETLDKDKGGTIDAEELSTAIRQNEELSLSASLEKAIDMVAKFDADGNGELDQGEFHCFVSDMVVELGLTVSAFCEYLIVPLTLDTPEPAKEQPMKLNKDKVRREVKRRRELFALLKAKGMENVFQMFDTESKGQIPFKVVAHSLYERTRLCDQSVQESMKVLLMMERNDKRLLTFEQFGRLIMTVSKTADLQLEELAEALSLAALALQPRDENFGSELVVDAEHDSNNEYGDTSNSLTYKKLRNLFKLWDADGDGNISLDELLSGLRAFQKASGTEVDATAMAEALIKFDEDGDSKLDPFEFITAMVQVTRQFEVPISGFIDAMVLLTSNKSKDRPVEDTDEDLAEVFGGSSEFATGIVDDSDWDDAGADHTEFSVVQFH